MYRRCLVFPVFPFFLFSLFLLAGCSDDEGSGPDDVEVPDAGAGSPDAAGSVTCADLTCGENAVCDFSGQDAECVCKQGYEGNGTECTDLDECADPSLNDCDPDAECTNTEGAYSCSCPEGFLGDGLSCEDVDECESEANTCHADASCVNDPGGFHCECDPGFTGDGLACEDVDECADPETYGCGENAVCVNTRGGYECECTSLYGKDDDGTCVPLCELALADSDVCDPNGRCRIDPQNGRAACTDCVPPYVGDGTNCVSVPECEALDCGPNTVCVDNGGWACECAAGFDGDPTDTTQGCLDIDECATDPCDDKVSSCLNTEGSYLCDCDTGYELDAGECVNIDECERELDNCDPDATCTDTTPGFTCACNSGFAGDGLVCADIDECKEGTHDCNLDYGKCTNTRGSFGCTDVDECANAALNDCDTYADCTNTDTGYTCACQSGFTGDGQSCRCDLSGFWAMRQDATLEWDEQSVLDYPTVSAGTLETTIWELHRYEYDGTTVTVQKKGCGQSDSPDIHSPFFDETYSSYIPLTVLDPVPLFPGESFDISAARPGDDFVTPWEAALVGVTMDEPLADAMTDFEWDDSEGDGVPGLMLWPRGTTELTDAPDDGSTTFEYTPVSFNVNGVLTVAQRAACVSGGGRVISRLQGSVDSCTRLTGEVVGDTNRPPVARIHSCTLAPVGPDENNGNWDTVDVTCTASDWSSQTPCNTAQVEFLDQQKQDQVSEATFEMVKIGELGDADMTCETVRTTLPEIPR